MKSKVEYKINSSFSISFDYSCVLSCHAYNVTCFYNKVNVLNNYNKNYDHNVTKRLRDEYNDHVTTTSTTVAGIL